MKSFGFRRANKSQFQISKLKKIVDQLILINLYLLIIFLPVSKSLIEITAGLAIGLWLFKKIFIEKDMRFERTPLNKPIALYIVFVVFSLFATAFMTTSLKGMFFKTFEHFLLFFVVADSIDDERTAKGYIAAVLLSCFIVGADGLWQFFAGSDFFRGYKPDSLHRISASFRYPNGFAAWLITVTPLPLALVFFQDKRSLKKAVYACISVVLVACLFLTFTRGAWAALAAALIFLSWRKGETAKKALLALIIAAIIALLLLFASPLKDKLLLYMVREASTMHRLGMIRICWRMILDSPLFGHGINTFMSILENYIPATVFGVTYAHNCYLQIAVETGIVSLIAFLWMIKNLFVSVIKDINAKKEGFIKAAQTGILAGLLGYLAHSGLETNLYAMQLAMLFYYFLGLAIGFGRIKAKT